MDRELSFRASLMYPEERDELLPEVELQHISPYAAVNAPQRGRRRQGRRKNPNRATRSAQGGRSVSVGAPHSSSAAVSLPRVEMSRRLPSIRCALPGPLRVRIQESFE